MKPRADHQKPHIPLSLGDPTTYGNFAAPPALVALMKGLLECVPPHAAVRVRALSLQRPPPHRPTPPPLSPHCSAQQSNGYQHSTGSAAARAAVAAVYNAAGVADMPAVTDEDVVIASGCSHALDLALCALLNPGDTLLVPRPGFPLYTTLCESRGMRVVQYACDPLRDWEVDVPALCTQLGEATAGGSRAALLLNNPSNPCGSVWPDAHVRELLAAAERFRVPVVADEIYWKLPFPRLGRYPLPAAGATRTVPVLTVGGLAKEFMVPGWRVGWVVVHDRGGALGEVRRGLKALSQLIMGANTVVQAALPRLLRPAGGSAEAAALDAWRGDTLARLQAHAEFTVAALRAIPGLLVVEPQGAMYCMFRVPAGAPRSAGTGGAGASGAPVAAIGEPPLPAHDDLAFARALLEEENVFVLPGVAFSAPGFCRVVITPPIDKLRDAFGRLAEFVKRNYA
jgi:tyrosine aminotransferase